MAAACPNKNSIEWITLVNAIGETRAMAVFMINEELPSIDIINSLIDLDNSKQIDKATEELEQLSKEGMSKKVDTFFNLIKIHWKRLGYSRYQEVRKIFDNPIVGNDFKSIYELLKDVAERDEQTGFEQKVRGFALGLQQINQLVTKVQAAIRAKDYSQMSEQEALKELSNFLVFLNEWKYTIEDFRKDFKDSPEVLKQLYQIEGNINTTTQIINNSREFSVIDEIVKYLEPTLIEQRNKFNEDIARVRLRRQQAQKRGDTTSVVNYNKRIKQLEEDYNKIKVQKSDVIEFLHGKRGDTNVASALFEAEINNPDPITAVVKKKITDILDDIAQAVVRTEQQFQKEIVPLLDELGANRFNPFDFYKQFTSVSKHISKNGSEYNVLELLDKFTGDWQFELESIQNEISKAKEENNKEAYDKARIKLAKFKKDYMHQEYKDVVYDRYELWEDEIGQKAYLSRQEIFDNLNSIIRKLKPNSSQGLDLTDEEELELKEEQNKLRRLASLYDSNGEKKTGDALGIAERIQEYNKKTRDIYEYKERVGAFERARERFKQSLLASKLDENSTEFKEAIAKWEDSNTRTVVKPSFYEDRQKILNKIKYLSSKVKDKVDQAKVKDFEEGWQLIFDQLKGYRDQDGQPVGTEISEPKADKIKDVQLQLEFLKQQIEGLNGLTTEENQELSRYWSLIKAKVRLSSEQQDRKDILENKRNSLGLSRGKKVAGKYIPGELDEFYNLINELKEIQTRIPTDYYVDALNQVAAPLGKVYDKETADKLIQDPELSDLLQDSTFKTWFERNHIQLDRYNEALKTKLPTWERTYIWNKIVPNDPNYFETTTLSDGTILQGLPDFQFYYRDVKDKYKTEPVIGETVDNRGNFLPKSYDKNNNLEAKDDKFINQEYYTLANSNSPEEQAKFKLLQTFKEYLLKAQEDLPYSDRLYLEIPRERKTFSERVKSGDYKGIKNSFLERLVFWDDASKDDEETNRTKIDKKVVKADLFGNPITQIPVKFTGSLSADNVSLNIPKAIFQYTLSTESKKALAEEQPFIEALEDILEANGKYSLSKVKLAFIKLQNLLSKTTGYTPTQVTEELVKEQGSYQRLTNIRNLQEQYFEGIYKKGFTPWQERGAVTQAIDSWFINPLLRLAGFGVMSADFAGAATNQISGNTYAILEGATGKYFSIKDYILASQEFGKLIYAFTEDLGQPLGKKSFHSQLFHLFDPQQTIGTEIGQKYDTNLWLNAGSLAKDFFLNPRIFGELQITASIMYATLRNIRVKYNGESIPLTEAYELDKYGYIKLKDGVKLSDAEFKQAKNKIRQAIRVTQGNYAKQDKTVMERSSIGAILMFMRRYFVPLLVDAWGVRRFNINTGSTQGYNLVALNVIKLGLQGIKDKTNYWDTISTQDKLSIVKASAFWTSSILFSLLIANLDPDDEKRKYKKLKNWTWLRLQLLLQALRVKSEVEQFTLIGGKNELIKTVKNPIMIGNKLSQMSAFSDAIVNTIQDDPDAYYTKGYKKMMEDVYGTDSKAIISVYKILGYRGGGLESFVPGSEKSVQTSAYRTKTTADYTK